MGTWIRKLDLLISHFSNTLKLNRSIVVIIKVTENPQNCEIIARHDLSMFSHSKIILLFRQYHIFGFFSIKFRRLLLLSVVYKNRLKEPFFTDMLSYKKTKKQNWFNAFSHIYVMSICHKCDKHTNEIESRDDDNTELG